MDFNSMLSKLKRDAKTSSLRDQASGAAKRARTIPNEEAQSSPRRPFPTQKVNNIFLACPPNVQTGGPEAMHQLCHKINSLTHRTETTPVSALMLYLEDRKGRVTHDKNAKPLEAYSIYSNIQVANSWQDDTDEGNLVIWPEIWTDVMDSLKGNHQNAIWWLSVNNNNGKFKGSQWEERGDILHLYQSCYAKNHIIKNLKTKNDPSKRVLAMTEFIAQRTLPKQQPSEISRDLQIVYNPFKGIHYTDEIKKRSQKKLKFTPIGGRDKLTPEQVKDLLHRAKVYIDFGPHPGMDRLPREAAMAKCIVITNKDGAAFYEEDVPIPSSYKVGTFDVDHIHKLLMESVDKYVEKKKNFDSYRDWIRNQEMEMETCVRNLISSIHFDR